MPVAALSGVFSGAVSAGRAFRDTEKARDYRWQINSTSWMRHESCCSYLLGQARHSVRELLQLAVSALLSAALSRDSHGDASNCCSWRPPDVRLVRSPLMSRAASSTGTWTESSSTGRGRVVHRRIASVVCMACACTKACRHASMQVCRHAGMHAHRHMSTRAFMFADMQAYTHMQRLFRCAELLSMAPKSPCASDTH